MGFHHDGQAGLELLTSGDPPTSASQSARITGVSHHARLLLGIFKEFKSGKWQTLWKTAFLRKGNIVLLYDPAIPLLHPREMIHPHENPYTNVHSGIIHNSRKAETTHTFKVALSIQQHRSVTERNAALMSLKMSRRVKEARHESHRVHDSTHMQGPEQTHTQRQTRDSWQPVAGGRRAIASGWGGFQGEMMKIFWN